jgi:hypothetical protein
MVLLMGSFVEGELYLSWMQFFPSLLLPSFFFFSLFAFLFLFQGLTRGQCFGVVTRVDSVTHKHFHRDDRAGS